MGQHIGKQMSVPGLPIRKRSRTSFVWQNLKYAHMDSGTDPWQFDATGKSASATLTRSSTEPLYQDTTSYLKCDISGADSGNAFARGQWNLTLPDSIYLRYRMGLFLPAGFNESVFAGSTMQISRFDPFPVLNNTQGALYDQPSDLWRMFLKDDGVDTDLTGTFAISENEWHDFEVRTYIHSSNGWIEVYLDGLLVASGYNQKTIYDGDDGSGNKITRFRAGIVAIGSTSQDALTLNIDEVYLDSAT